MEGAPSGSQEWGPGAGKAVIEARSIYKQQIVKLLLQSQADRDLADLRGCTPLHKAAGAGCLRSVCLLLRGSSPASVNRRDGLLLTPLHRAVLGGHADVASCLLEHGTDVNAAGWLGKTALHLAAEKKLFPLVELLIAKGADLSRKTWWKETAEEALTQSFL
ncbi:B-cell lymphoma 3 protein homolog isoform 3-T3 [Vipera latastei]